MHGCAVDRPGALQLEWTFAAYFTCAACCHQKEGTILVTDEDVAHWAAIGRQDLIDSLGPGHFGERAFLMREEDGACVHLGLDLPVFPIERPESSRCRLLPEHHDRDRSCEGASHTASHTTCRPLGSFEVRQARTLVG